MTVREALAEFDLVQQDEMGPFAVCCGVPVVMDSADGRPKMYCITCGRTITKLQLDQWTVTEWGTKGIRMR